MITEIRVKKDSFEEECLYFKKAEFGRLNILIGGNGIGKTTLLSGIRENNLDIKYNKDSVITEYTNSVHNYKNLDLSLNYKGCTGIDVARRVSNTLVLSEGQAMMNSIMDYFSYMEELIIKEKNKDIVVLLDEVDSGLSLENINILLHEINDLINKYDNLQFFIASNNYHFVYVVKKVFDMRTGKFIKINSYEEYFKLLFKNGHDIAIKNDFIYLEKDKFINGGRNNVFRYNKENKK